MLISTAGGSCLLHISKACGHLGWNLQPLGGFIGDGGSPLIMLLVILLAKIKPLTYSVHSVRYWLTSANTGFEYMNTTTDLIVLFGFTITMSLLAIKVFEKTTLED